MRAKLSLALFFGIFLLIAFAYAQNRQDRISIVTYYPSPEGAFKNLQVNTAAAVGNISESGLSGLTTVEQLQPGQVYIGNSLILNNLTASPINPKPGQIAYVWNATTHKGELMFYNGTWVKVGGN